MMFCPLYSGSSGNSTLLEGGGARVLIDAGLPGKMIERALSEAGVEPHTIDAIVITHEHSDHIRGVGVLSRRYGLPIYANEGTWRAMNGQLGAIKPANIRIFETGRDFYIKALNILAFATPHDAAEPVGYSFSAAGRKVSVMTDIGHINNNLLCAVEGADLLLIEANHDVPMLQAGSYPYTLKRRILSDKGHLSNENAGKALAKLYLRGVRNAILGHLSRENNCEQLCMETVRAALRLEDIPDEEFRLAMAYRDRPAGMFRVG